MNLIYVYLINQSTDPHKYSHHPHYMVSRRPRRRIHPSARQLVAFYNNINHMVSLHPHNTHIRTIIKHTTSGWFSSRFSGLVFFCNAAYLSERQILSYFNLVYETKRCGQSRTRFYLLGGVGGVGSSWGHPLSNYLLVRERS